MTSADQVEKLKKKMFGFLKDAADFLILDDVKTVFDPKTSLWDKGVAIFSVTPTGKAVKAGRLGFKLVKNSPFVKKAIVKNMSKPKEPFVPDSHWRKKAPHTASPGSKVEHYREYNGKIEKSTVVYDDFGRQKYRIDHSDHSMPLSSSLPALFGADQALALLF